MDGITAETGQMHMAGRPLPRWRSVPVPYQAPSNMPWRGGVPIIIHPALRIPINGWCMQVDSLYAIT